MTEFTMTRTLGLPYERAVTAVREGLAGEPVPRLCPVAHHGETP